MTRSRFAATVTLAVAACAGVALPAQAAPMLALTGWAFGTGHNVATTAYGGAAGGFTGRLTGAGAYDSAAFLTYCVELSESFAFSAAPQGGYSIVAGSSYFGADKAARLGRLLTYVADNPTAVDTSAESTALQLAIWNVVYDSDWTLASGGSFSDGSAYRGRANTLLAGAQGVLAPRFEVAALKKTGSQDFLLASLLAADVVGDGLPLAPNAVPAPGGTVSEPASLALASLALLTGALLRRRRG